MSTLGIRQATTNDLGSILQLFQNTVQTINANDYAPDQIRVWKTGAGKKTKWIEKISEQYFLVAEVNNTVAGFGSITQNGYLDFMYVNKDYQRMGTATRLYEALELFARSRHLRKITSDVSITAKPFFEKQGFIILQQQQVIIDGVALINYKMEKFLHEVIT